jgi:GBP family porin
MYKKISGIALSSMACFSVHASSNVTMYGIADSAVTYVSNKQGSSSTELNSGNLNTSRWGLRGKEDLGGGLSAIFNFEAGIGLDTGSIGSATTFWNRQSWVGLSSTSWGELKAGYQRPSFYDLFGPLSHTPPFGSPAARIDGAGIAGSSLARFNNTIGTTRYANSVKYITPNMMGFKLHTFMGLGEVAGSSSANRTLNIGLGYKKDNLTAGISYLTTECLNAAGCLNNQAKDKVAGVGVGYTINRIQINGIYTSQKNSKNIRGNDADTASVSVSVPINQWTLAAGYQMLNDKSNLNQDVKQLNFSALYNLSKRTALYTIIARQTVKNGGIAGISFLSSSSSQNQASFGLRHRF